LKAGIIAAGLGERMAREGISTPKPLVQVGGETLISRVIRAAAAAGAASVACIVNDLNPAVARYLRSISWPVPLELIVKTTPSSMESLFSLAPFLQREPFLLLTVDAVFGFPALQKFQARASALRQAQGVLALTRWVDDEKPLWAEVDRRHKLLALGETARTGRHITAGYYYFKPDVFEMVDSARARRLNALRQFLGFLLERGYSLYGLPVPKTIDVDHPRDIPQAEIYLRRVDRGRNP
jgi:NDP-sugar pyrophosphorylase family protein